MKKLLSLFLLLSVYSLSFAKSIDEATAKKAGQNFLATRTTVPLFKSGAQLQLVQTVRSKAYNALATSANVAYYYIFNVSNGDGFVVVSGDDNAIPILGYSSEVDFDIANIAPQTAKWLEGYKNQLRYIIDNNLTQTEEIKKDWEDLLNGKRNDNTIAASVTPLVQTKWDQSPYYNSLCPYDNSASQRTVTGCVATAMAQVMKFWSYPATGTSYHSYNHSKYGTLSANFGSTNYNWGAMPNRVTSSNTAVATLMYQLGVSVDMNYGVGSTGGSGAYVITSQSPVTHCTEYALKTYFGYKNTLSGIERVNYTQSQWLTTIKGELNAGRPIIYAGFGSGGGHCFVNDGYDNNDFLHFNWGWDGQHDGYFSVNALNPGGVGTGGGTGGFNSGHQAVIGIEPPVSNPTALDMRLYSAITVSPNPIKYNQAFDVSVDVANFGANSTQNFTGDYTVAVFNSNNDYVATVETKTGMTLDFNKHYTNPLVFSTTGLAALTPGDNTIGVYYKKTGTTEWVAFADGAYKNFLNVTVEGNNTNPLKLYAAVTTTPTVIVRNQTFTVDFDIANFANSTFTGDVSVDIHKSDGTWIRELSVKTGLSLPTNTHFTNGLTYTITGGISDEAGTYQLFIWDKPNSGSWEFVGNGTYANPITIQVVEPGLSPDVYEVNNTAGQAANLPVAFTANTATVSTNKGSNCHNGNDYDYYKIVLPAGYNYEVGARIHDSHSSGNGNTYSLDGLVSYSTDGTTWSDAYDDIIAGTIVVNGGGTVYFYVSPYFTGETGTYLFVANITRLAALSTEKDITGFAVPGMVGNATIIPNTASVDIVVTAQTDVTNLIPTITISNKASINPPSGILRNFTNSVIYTVTAEDNSQKPWTIRITKQAGVGIADVAQANTISVYPNPANNNLFIDANNFGGTITGIAITNMQGQTMLTDYNVTDAISNISLQGLQSGVYMVQIQTSEGTVIKKVIKQ